MYNYNKAKDAMSLVMPDFMLAYAQQQEDIIIPSRETHGDILLIAAVDMLDFGECSKNKNNYNSEAAEACLNRPRILKKYLN